MAADVPVRVIDAFVNGLDARGLGFGRAVPAVMDRLPYDPRDLMKLYLIGYLNEVRSSLRLERECSRNLEVMSLLRRWRPTSKRLRTFAVTILFTARLVALDGSKLRGGGKRQAHYWPARDSAGGCPFNWRE